MFNSKTSKRAKLAATVFVCTLPVTAFIWLYQEKDEKKPDAIESKLNPSVSNLANTDSYRFSASSPRVTAGSTNSIAKLRTVAKRKDFGAPNDEELLEGREAWNTPEFEECHQLFDPANLDEAVQIHVKWTVNEAGVATIESEASSGCFEQNILDVMGLELRPCSRSEKPEPRPELARCENARLAKINRLPKGYVAQPGVPLEFALFHLGLHVEDEASHISEKNLPQPDENATKGSPADLAKRSPSWFFGHKDGPRAVTVCADFHAFSRTVLGYVQRAVQHDPELEVHWFFLPLSHEPSAFTKAALALSMTAQGLDREALSVLFDVAGEASLEDLLAVVATVGADIIKTKAHLHDPAIQQAIANQRGWCIEHGLVTTPSALIGDKVMLGITEGDFVEAIANLSP